MPNPTTYAGRATAPQGMNPTSQGGGKVVNVDSSSVYVPQQPLIPFSRAAKLRIDAGRQQNGTLATATSNMSFTPIPTTGYLSTLYLQVAATSAGNAAAVAFQPDANWNFFQSILFRDATGNPIVNLVDGYGMYLAAKYGAYRLGRPEGSAFDYSQTTGAVGAGGSFTFTLPIHCEFGRDPLGTLANMNASAAYQLDLIINTLANIYTVLPTNPPTFTVTLYLESYTQPPDTIDGNPVRTEPPALGSTQFWSVQNASWSGTGEQTVQLVRVGNLQRMWFLLFRTAAGARSGTVLPAANWRIELDQAYLQNQNTRLDQFLEYRYYQYDLETGLLLINFAADPDNIMTGEYGDRWLQTMAQTRVAFVFTPGVAGSLQWYINDIAPQGDIYRVEL